jgi:D-tagatose-1,6-bisphosphate aldolase subunit GatZ/KbaZ
VHPLQQLVQDRAAGRVYGIYSACTANEYAIEAAFQRARDRGGLPCPPADIAYTLIEATANQVNQFGGYTGMKPADFAAFVKGIANRMGFPEEKLILGGDHLGPLVWQNEPADSAMAKSAVLVADYVKAGFTKLHLDTSMKLADDDPNVRLPDRTIAARAAMLARVAGEALPNGFPPPVFVIGSEVPIPGGEQEAVSSLAVTTAGDMKNTILAFENAFASEGVSHLWNSVVALVVQPGVEFGDDAVFPYDRAAAAVLCAELTHYPNLVFEGHSTDYQPPRKLREMVEDGVCILKVGPALTFYLREALFALESVERALGIPAPSGFSETLERVMAEQPGYWQKYYPGTPEEQAFKRKYSYSDRCRYYLPLMGDAIHRLLANLSGNPIPLSLLSQFMPVQAARVRDGLLPCEPKALLIDRVGDCIDDYTFATRR